MAPFQSEPVGSPLDPTRPRILVVEDEILIRCMISDELRDAGYGVIEAYNADEAAEVLDTGAAVDFVISDVKMPGEMDGLDLLKHVRDKTSELPVLMMSAHLDPRLVKLDDATRFVAKPFSLTEVLTIVRNALDRRK